VNLRRALTPLRLATVGLLILVAVVVVLLTTSSNEYLLVPDRAHPLASLVTVPNARPPHDGGGIYYVDVIERKATLLERLFPGLRSGSTLVQHSQLAPPGVSDAQRLESDRLDMQLSQQVASAVALKALGYKIKIRQKGVRVALVYGRTHAVGKLEPNDVIVSVDGKPTLTLAALHAAISKHSVGDVVRIGFLRNGARRDVSIATSKDPFGESRSIIGIQPAPNLRLNLPFKIGFDLGNVGGPSAGLAFALQILEERGRDVDRGYKVAATGEIAPDGSVGAIGGIKQKVIGASTAGVDVFLVPTGNYQDARKYAHGVKIIPVKSFQQALHALATLPRRG
jgi:Lon-like protease